MSDLALMAATAFAQAHAPINHHDPIKFGRDVALAYSACRVTAYHAGDEAATTAALAALSVRPEVLQAIALLASLSPGCSVKAQTDLAGAGA